MCFHGDSPTSSEIRLFFTAPIAELAARCDLADWPIMVRPATLVKFKPFNASVEYLTTMVASVDKKHPRPLNDMDLRLLRIFEAVVRAGGFAAAEADLNLSRSTISLYINKLEARLGIRLCNRGRGGFSLTERGKVVYQAMQNMMSSLEDFRAEVGAVRGHLIGELNLGVMETTVTDPSSHLVLALSRFCQQAPAVHVSLYVSSGQEIERAVLRGELHLGIVPLLHKVPKLEYDLLYYEESALFCGSGHRFFQKADTEIEDGAIDAAEYAGRGYVETADPTERKLDARRCVTSSEMEGIAMLILTGKFIGYLPNHFAKLWVSRGDMRAIRPSEYGYRSEIHVVAQKGRRKPLPVQTFLDELQRAHGTPV